MHRAVEGGSRVHPDAVRAQLDLIVASEHFRRSIRTARFLRYVVERTLQGRASDLKEYVIALEVFDRPETYDPQVDATVRVEAGKLRLRLQKYYEAAGLSDPIRIEIPKGAYVPVFTHLAVPLPASVCQRPGRRILLLVVGLTIVATAALVLLGPWRKPKRPSPAAWAEMQYGDVLRSLVSVQAGRKSIDHFRRAVTLDPKSASTHAELAYACVSLAETAGIGLPKILQEAIEEANRAIRLDRSSASAHVSLGMARLFGSRDWDGAARDMRRAMELDPSDVYLRTQYARYCLIPHGRFNEAVKQYEMVLKVDPASSTANTHLAATYLRMGKVDLAVQRLRRAVELYPDSPGTLVWLGIAEHSSGRTDQALQLFREALRVSPRSRGPLGTWAFFTVSGSQGRS